MKTKDYLKKFNLTAGWDKKVQKEFISDLSQEFLALCEMHKAQDNIKGFNNAVKAFSDKWNAISNKVPYGLPDSLWNFFYATVVVPAREQFCPAEMERRRAVAEQKRIEREQRNAWRKEQEEYWQNVFREAEAERRRNFFRFLAATIILNSLPIEAFQFMSLPVTATEEEIMKKFRLLSLKMHPDHGGNQEDFIKLVEAKNKCIAWISR